MLIASQQVNRIGKYIYKHIDSAYKYSVSGNMNDIWFTVFYEYLIYPSNPHEAPYYSETHEMHININVTTYQNKIRINLIEVSPDEQTLGYFLYPVEIFENIQQGFTRIWRDVDKKLHKVFDGYVFIY